MTGYIGLHCSWRTNPHKKTVWFNAVQPNPMDGPSVVIGTLAHEMTVGCHLWYSEEMPGWWVLSPDPSSLYVA